MSERDWVKVELERVRRKVAELEAVQRERANPAHEHDWFEHDGSRHCYKCQRTEHGVARAAGRDAPGARSP